MVNHRKKSGKDSRKSFQIKLPAHLGRAFEDELRSVMSSVASSSVGNSTEAFKFNYQIEEMFSKYLDEKVIPEEIRESAAIEKWLKVEESNVTTNMRLMFYHDDHIGRVPVGRLVNDIQRLIRKILGPFDYHAIMAGSNHTNGASTRIKRSPKAAIDKLAGDAHVSRSALEHWVLFADQNRLREQALEICNESVMFTVPKKSDINRVACKEPEINMLLQKSCGNYIRRQLRRCGIDLNDQSRNQKLAEKAHSLGLATIDLSSASDSVTKQLVMLLLPWEWYDLLSDLRVERTLITHNKCEFMHELEMFSSMGNGFTFELESLLFYAITRVVQEQSGVEGKLSVYGDDIIAPKAIVPRLRRTLAYFGFKVNIKKTHWTGLFRESCGKHYYDGADVSPFYVRGPITSMTALIKTLNQLLEWDARNFGFFITEDIAKFHRKWSGHVPDRLHGGPDTERTDSLVTGDAPRDYIVEPVMKRFSKLANKRVGIPLTTDGYAHLSAWLLAKELQTQSSDYVCPPMVMDTSIKYKPLEYCPILDGQWGEPLQDNAVELTYWKKANPKIRRLPSYTVPTLMTPYLLYGKDDSPVKAIPG